MGFCSKCGAVINARDPSCNKCGAKFEVVEVIQSLISEAESKRREMAEFKRHGVWAMVFSVFGLIITVIGLTIGLIERTGIEQDALGIHIYQYHPYRNEAWVMTVGGNLLVLVAASIGLYYCNKNRRLLQQLQSRNDGSGGAL